MVQAKDGIVQRNTKKHRWWNLEERLTKGTKYEGLVIQTHDLLRYHDNMISCTTTFSKASANR